MTVTRRGLLGTAVAASALPATRIPQGCAVYLRVRPEHPLAP